MKNMCCCLQSHIVPIVQGADGMWKKESAAIGKRNAKKMNIVPIKSKNVPQINRSRQMVCVGAIFIQSVLWELMLVTAKNSRD